MYKIVICDDDKNFIFYMKETLLRCDLSEMPKRLSNGICSLNEGQERLALSCIMTINEKGHVIGHQIAETVIRVDRRMTYTAVNAILTEPETHPELLEEYHELVPMFRQMQELSALIRSCRKKRGAIDFEFQESKVILDAEMCIRDRQ